MKKIKWGIIGLGNIAKRFASTITNLSDECELYGVASRELEKAKEFAKKYNATKAFGSYEDLVKDSEVDLIYIATPHSLHKENMILCINNGKGVLCEKPFTIDTQEAEKVFNLAKQKNVFVMEAFWTKLLPVYVKVYELIQSGTIGNLKFINAQFGGIGNEQTQSRLFDPKLGGGALLDIGIYCVWISCMFFGYEPTKIKSTIKIHPKYNVDILNSAILEYPKGCISQISSSIIVELDNSVVLYGDKGKIIIPEIAKAQKFSLIQNNTIQEFNLPYQFDGFEYQIREAIKCYNDGKLQSTLITHDNTLSVMKILDEIRIQNNYYFR